MKRLISTLLSLAMVVALFAGLSITGDAASYTYNKGVKGAVCTELSSAAKSYYTSGYDWDTLSKLTGTALEAKLRTKMASGYSANSYDGLKTLFKYSDSYKGSSSNMYFFYTGTSGSSNMNREHVWPRSQGDFEYETGTAGADILHLRPSDANVNSARSNLPYGEVTGGAYTNVYAKSGALGGYKNAAYFEPLDGTKGDVARILLYVYTRWEQRNLTDVIESTDLLLKWCEQDPVDDFEMGRNDVCQQITNSRNVYVDYPEYCWLVFNKVIPTHMKTPSGKGNTCSSPDYTAEVTKAPTCTTAGVKTYTCKNCGYSYTESIPATGHHYVSGQCEYCGKAQPSTQYLYTATPAAGDEVVIYNPANKALMTSTAKVYGGRNELQYITATTAGDELTFTGTSAAVFTVQTSGTKYAFKTSDGKYLTCAEAQNLSLETSPASGTNYWTLESTGSGSWYVKNTTTYYEDYTKHYQYLEYYYAFTTYGMGTSGGDAFAMTFYKKVGPCSHDYQITATQAATCTEQGYTTYQCSKCGDVYTEYSSALGHVDENADGRCDRCSALMGECSHDWGTGTVTTAATYSAPGVMTYTCGKCGETKTGEIPALALPFVDVKDTDYFRAPVAWALDNAITYGDDETHFAPQSPCTREQVVTFLWRASGKPAPKSETCPFVDVKPTDYSYDAVRWAAEQGITMGTDDTHFSPKATVTRAQFVSFLWRADGKPEAGTENTFTDLDENEYYVPAVLWAVEKQITVGTGNGKFSPDAPCLREQVVTFLYRDR